MKKDFWPGPTPCNVCSAVVFYTRGRRRCRKCRSWCHEECTLDNGDHNLCLHCVRKSPGRTFHRIALDMNGGKEPFPALEVVLWSCVFGQDEEEISAKLGFPLDKVREWGDRLRKDHVWENGRVNLDEHDRSSPQEQSIVMILVALVADGMVVRESVGPPNPAVSEVVAQSESAFGLQGLQRGTEQDGKQEGEEGDLGSAT